MLQSLHISGCASLPSPARPGTRRPQQSPRPAAPPPPSPPSFPASAVLQLYDGRARRSRHRHYPRILFLVTGRGPQRAEYEERMRSMDLRFVAFR